MHEGCERAARAIKSHALASVASALTALAAAGCMAQAAPRAPQATITIGIVNNNEPGFRSEVLAPTVRYLQSTLPQFRFRTVDIAAYRAADDVRRTEPDFVIAPSDVFLTLTLGMGAHPLAVRRSRFARDANRSVGSAVVVLKTRTDITELSHLQGKTVSASLPDSLGGWLALRAELAQRGYNEKRFFAQVDFRTFQIPEVISDVLNGRSDAGVLSSCQLERAESAGMIAKGKLKVIDNRASTELACAHTTALYPDQIFGAMSDKLDDEILKSINVALLQMPLGWGQTDNRAGVSFSWQVAGRFDEVSDLLRTLKLGPYSHLQDWTLEGIVRRFSREIALVLLLVAVLGLNELRLMRLVRIRTAKLKSLLQEKERMLEQVRNLSQRLHVMERNSLVSQMSSMIAHELKQPLASIINYCAVLDLQLESPQLDAANLADLNAAIDKEAHRITQIVDRVRSYVKQESGVHRPHELDALVRKAHESLANYSDRAPEVVLDLQAADACINAEGLEIEILILNLMKNASRAVKKVAHGTVTVCTRADDCRVTLEVRDNGPRLSEADFRRLTQDSDSTRSEGLGLGLPIVRSIVDAHSATLHVEQLVPQGIGMRVTFERVAAHATNEEGP